jgi:hypothetical protein
VAEQTCKKPLNGAFYRVEGQPYCADDVKAFQAAPAPAEA